MKPEEMKKIHREIDIRMQELEDSGLTREEILYNRQVRDKFGVLYLQEGIVLADDPFFQFIKGNRTAREMLIKPGELFSADNVIEKALRQELGPDPTLAIHK